MKQFNHGGSYERRKKGIGKLDAQLKEWKPRIVVLKSKADKAKADTKMDYYKIIQVLEHKGDEVRTKLQELKIAGDEAWEDHNQALKKYGMNSRPPSMVRLKISNRQERRRRSV